MSRTNCQFVPWEKGRFPIDPPDDLPGWWICANCQRPRSIRFRDPNWRGTSRECGVQVLAPELKKGPPRKACIHIGEQRGVVECMTCTGATRIKTFACDLHELATLGKKLPGIACCKPGQCKDYSPRFDTADEDGSAAG